VTALVDPSRNGGRKARASALARDDALSSDATPPSQRWSIERIRTALLWLTALSGAFVFIEPGPYEMASCLTMFLFAITGLSLRASLMPLVLMLILCNLGFSISVALILGDHHAETWVLISWYLSATAIFYAAVVVSDTARRLELIVHGNMLAAMVASLAGIVGFFHLIPGLSDSFLRYDRVRGTFNDPNVLGAFLVFPALIALQRVLVGGFADTVRNAGTLVLFMMALLLTYSRAAWGQFVASAALMMTLMFITSPSKRQRMRIVAFTLVGVVAVTALIVSLLSIEQVGQLFWERASLEQSYDIGPLGRFSRQALGALMVLDHPLGIGPLQFTQFFSEDPHNAYLDSFLAGGWLSGVCYAAAMVVTLIVGLQFVFVATPWRQTYTAVYAAFFGVFVESAIIDSNHWRHYFLLLGLAWGLMTASRSYLAHSHRPTVPDAPRERAARQGCTRFLPSTLLRPRARADLCS
jgi:O-Antigen ligase